jgi:hypothetical protein
MDMARPRQSHPARFSEKADPASHRNPAPEAVIQVAEFTLVAVVFLALADRFFKLISDYAVNIFFSDQWDFNDATLFQSHSLWQMFRWQHGPHRQGAGALLQWIAEPLFSWNSRTESFVAGGIIAVAALCAMYLKSRLYGRISVSDVIIPILFFTPLQYETLFVTANFAHGPLPLLLIVLYCLAWTLRHPAVRYGFVLIVNFVTIYTGFGLLLGLLTPLLLAADYWVNLRDTKRGRLYFVISLLIACVSFGSFFVGYKMEPAVACFSPQPHSPILYGGYAALMFGPIFGAWRIGAFPILVGATAVCALLIVLIISITKLRVKGKHWAAHAVIGLLIAYCLLFCLATAYGRLCLGIDSAQASRYVIYLNLGLLGLYFGLLTIRNSVARNAALAILALSLFRTIEPPPRVLYQMAMWHNVKQEWKSCYVTLGDIEECNRYAKVYPWEPERTHLQEKLDFLKQTRQNLFADSK